MARAADANVPGSREWPIDQDVHTCRGGNWMSGAEVARSALRGQNQEPDFSFMALGLRPVRFVDPAR